MLCAPPVQAPVPQLILVRVSKHPRQKPPQAMFRELLGNAGLQASLGCASLAAHGPSMAMVGPPPSGGRVTGGTQRRGTQNWGEVWSSKRGHRTVVPHPLERAPLQGRGWVSGTSGVLKPETMNSCRGSQPGDRPTFFDERREGAPAPGKEQGSEAKLTVPLSSSCLQSCPSGPFLTQAIILKPCFRPSRTPIPMGPATPRPGPTPW